MDDRLTKLLNTKGCTVEMLDCRISIEKTDIYHEPLPLRTLGKYACALTNCLSIQRKSEVETISFLYSVVIERTQNKCCKRKVDIVQFIEQANHEHVSLLFVV